MGRANTIGFADCVIEKFSFRIQPISSDCCHEFLAKIHWHVEDLGIRHDFIKQRSLLINGKVERSHRSDH
jgi:hypothetical protein